ncbi:MAG: multicopper oxidase domain-containing protein [Acidobacteria bacterium]|nr:multicopper oxidase domain-containing protein [Acidobacteriota bacterium]
MPPTRRTFLQQATAAALASAAWTTRRGLAQPLLPTAPRQMSMPMTPRAASPTDSAKPMPPMIHAASLTPFVDVLPMPTPIHINADGKSRIAMRETHVQLHRDLPPTRMWVYADAYHPTANPSALAPILDARCGHPLSVEWLNQLPTRHFLPIDYSLHGCGHDVPEVRTCVHLHGGRTPSRDDGYPDDWYTPGHARSCRYPLQQDPAMLWYHDHAMGLNRLNIYAGLVGMAILRDPTEDALNLPSGPYELPITLYDRLLTADAQLYYPDSGDPEHPWVPEFDGDAILVNGKLRPYLDVEPRLYRLRLLNAANSRFFALSLSGHQPFHQIGSDQGLLPAPVSMNNLLLAPAERADLLIDLTKAAGQNLHLLDNGLGILQLRVAATASATPAQYIPTALRAVPRAQTSAATVTRSITLDEALSPLGNPMVMLLNKKRWHEPVTEQPRLNATEIWEFINLTEDTHPMHLHLVRFQVLDRRAFDVFAYRNSRGLHYIADPLPPEPNETGFRDVVQCPSGLITRILVNFNGYPGKYLYHCHILEHEANDMMRPFEVVA